jgi:hypothetical protein
VTGDEYGEVIDRLGLSKTGAAKFLRVDETTSRRWSKDQHPIPIPVVMLLRTMVRHGISPASVIANLERNHDLEWE